MRRGAVALAAIAATAVCIQSASPAHIPPAGEALGVIVIPRIGLRQPLDQGGWDIYTAAWPATLDAGPAHYPSTPLPWQKGQTAFAGHRTTFTHPFLHLDDLRRGDEIILLTPHGRFVYHVFRMRIVSPKDIKILHYPRRGHRLLLTACHPPHLATYRLAIWASR